MEHMEDFILALLRSGTSNSSLNMDWKGKLFATFQETVKDIVDYFLKSNENLSNHEKTASSRQKRSLNVDDLRSIFEELFPQILKSTKIWIEFFKNENVIQHNFLEVSGLNLKRDLELWLRGVMQHVVDTVLEGQVCIKTSAKE